MKGKYTVFKDKPKEFFDLIPSAGVTHLLAEEDPKHNAVWDMAISPEGRVFFSVCGESYDALYARLYEYDPNEKKLIRHLELEKAILMSPHSIRTSKFHTAISFIGNGKILTTTHTTSPAPTHPTWMPYEYADHPYEGYPGSNLLIYDYVNRVCTPLGVFTPHDTTYGATYDPKNGDYLAITWMRGQGYVFNLHTREVRCLGQLSDSHTSRTFLLSDGHIYGSTYSGAMFRYNTDIREIEWLGVSAPGLIRHAREWDGKLYFTTGPCSVAGRGQLLYSYDLKTRCIETVGRAVPEAEALPDVGTAFYNAYGMAFDEEGRMWYGCMTFIEHHRYVGARLYMWDFLHGKEPVDCGFLGSEKRTLSITAEMHINRGILYVSDGNHTGYCDTPSGIIAIELDKFIPALNGEPRRPSQDFINYLPYQMEALEWYPGDDLKESLALYDEYYNNTVLYFESFLSENNAHARFAHASGVSVWEKLGRESSEIKDIEWTSEDTLYLYCGKEGRERVEIFVDSEGNASVSEIQKCKAKTHNSIKAQIPTVTLPSVPGRSYLANPSASVTLKSGKLLVGTEDSVLALIDGEEVFSLGQVTSAGAITSLDVTPDGKAYGVASHPLGVGRLFSFSEKEGLRLLGILPEAMAECGRNVAIYRPSVVSLSPSGKYLAVGGKDELGGAVIVRLS